jgi:hypothetical protein
MSRVLIVGAGLAAGGTALKGGVIGDERSRAAMFDRTKFKSMMTKEGMEKLLDIFKTIFMPLDLQMLVQMESMHQCQHHLIEWFQKDKPMLRSYTAPPLTFHGNFSSRIR